jgi:hypothetical protein
MNNVPANTIFSLLTEPEGISIVSFAVADDNKLYVWFQLEFMKETPRDSNWKVFPGQLWMRCALLGLSLILTLSPC